MHKHCCQKMDISLPDKNLKVSYFPVFRQYTVRYKDNSSTQTIRYCPWCGRKFLPQLAEEWSEELEKLGFDDPFDENIPLEFKNDTWWKSRKYHAALAEK